MNPPVKFQIAYLPALDGLRTLAIIAVMAYHATMPFAKGGFIGVDVFFTLSGFLITALLLQEYDTHGNINLKNFYVRRALRLIPALYIFLAVFLAYDVPIKGLSAVEESTVVILNITNWVRAFKLFPTVNMDHMWSLAVEEQFYFVWPFMLALFLRLRFSINRIGQIVLGISGILLLMRVALILSGASADRVYNGSDTRAGAILIGCALALALNSPQFPFRLLSKLMRRLEILFGLALICAFGWSLLFAQRDAPQTYYLLPELIGLFTSGIILDIILFKPGILNRILMFRPFVELGRMSYGIYLWHFPIFGILLYKAQFSPIMTLLVGGVISVGVAFISYRFLEQPVLKLRTRFAQLR